MATNLSWYSGSSQLSLKANYEKQTDALLTTSATRRLVVAYMSSVVDAQQSAVCVRTYTYISHASLHVWTSCAYCMPHRIILHHIIYLELGALIALVVFKGCSLLQSNFIHFRLWHSLIGWWGHLGLG